jgi:YVTN family beta-propeller protein
MSRRADTNGDVDLRLPLLLACICGIVLSCVGCSTQLGGAASSEKPAVPSRDLAITTVLAYDAHRVFVACSGTKEVLEYDRGSGGPVRSFRTPKDPSGLAVSPDRKTLFVTCAAPESFLCIFDVKSGKLRKTIPTGHTSMCPVASPDGTALYVCNQFDDSVSVIDLMLNKEVARIPVPRQPVSAALSKDGRFLFVANHLHSSRADVGVVHAQVSVIDTSLRKAVKGIPLPNGSALLRGMSCSPDGRHIIVAHNLARFHLPTTTVIHGWMNNSALSLIDTEELALINTVLLDDVELGAANPWAVGWTDDGRSVYVTHAGTHELSVIDAPGLFEKLSKLPLVDPNPRPGYFSVARTVGDVPNDLRFLRGLRKRIPLRGNGPRSLSVIGTQAVIGDYFSNDLEFVDVSLTPTTVETASLGENRLADARRGEMLFNDASLCYEHWQSCASCHSSDARVDGLNWDLQNDGIGNPKNVKSLLLAFETPPVMSMGVRADASAAIRAGIKFILFTNQPPEIPAAIDAYVRALKPVASPELVHGKLSTAAQRGKILFESPEVGCSRCHAPPLFTDCKPHNVGTGKFDETSDQFYTPTLIEAWRTAPYLHDGSAATLREAVTIHNRNGRRGSTTQLAADQIVDLVEYLRSL